MRSLQLDRKLGPPFGAVPNLNPAAVILNDLFRVREPQAGARFLGTDKWIEDRREQFLRYTGAFIPDVHQNGSRALLGYEADAAAWAGAFDGIQE